MITITWQLLAQIIILSLVIGMIVGKWCIEKEEQET